MSNLLCHVRNIVFAKPRTAVSSAETQRMNDDVSIMYGDTTGSLQGSRLFRGHSRYPIL
jgi:hypothetical protein